MSRQILRNRLWVWLAGVILPFCIFQDVSAQVGLTIPSSTSMTMRYSGRILALPLTGPAPNQGKSGILTKLSDRQVPNQRRSSTRESEIAAIFRGVAYGAPTFSSNTSTSSTSTAPTTSSITSTTTIATTASATQPMTADSFNNRVRDPVRSELMRHQLPKETEYFFTTSKTLDIMKGKSDTFPYIEHEDNSFRDTSYVHRTSDLHGDSNKADHDFFSPSNDKDNNVKGKKNTADSSDIREQSVPQIGVKWALGAAWWIHVYVSAGLFALTAAASLCCLARLSPATHLLSRLRYVTLLVFVFLAAILRSLHLFHDPYGIENRLPDFLSAVVEETSWPCLTGALTLIALTLYESGRCSRVFPKSSPLSYTLIFFTFTHLTISIILHTTASLFKTYSFPLKTTAQSISVIWGGVVGFAVLLAVWKIERSSGRYSGHLLGRLNRSATDDLVSSAPQHSAVNRGAILILVAGVGQIMLSALHLYIALAPVTPTKHMWVWWGRVSMARGLELVISVAVLTGAYILTSGRSSKSKQDTTIFSVLTSCGRENKNTKVGRSANVFPVQNEKRQILGSFNFNSNKPEMNDADIKRLPIDWTYTTPRRHGNKTDTIDSVTSDFQLLWNRDRAQSAASFRPSSMLVNDSGFVRFRTHVDPEQGMDEVFNKSSLNLHKTSTPVPFSTVQNYNTQTLPNSRYYCKPNSNSLSSPERTPLRNPIRAHTVRAQRNRPDYMRHHMRNRTMSQVRDKSPWMTVTPTKCDARALDRYEVASYYNNSIASNSSNVYSMPHTVTASQQYLKVHGSHDQLPGIHGSHLYEDARDLKPVSTEAISGVMEPSTCSSMSEIHVDYLTDVSSSNDCMNQNSVPYPQCSKRNHNVLTLPLSSTHTSFIQGLPIFSNQAGMSKQIHLPDITPDSAVILDYSTSAETEEEGCKDDRNNRSLDLLKLSSNSLNDVLKGQTRAGLFSKIVSNSMSSSCYGYSPLDVDDTSSPSQEDSTLSKIRQVTSSTEFCDAQDIPKTTDMSNKTVNQEKSNSTVTAL